MRIGYYTAALGIMLPRKRLEVIANNLANVETPGFKHDRIYFKNFMEEASYTVMRQGRLRRTGSPLDVAINGEGFFKVQRDGQVLYTRDGNFCINQNGQLTTQEGWLVMGNSGPIELSNSIERGTDVRIEPDGRVFDGNDEVGKIEVVKFPKGARLRKTKHGYFKPEQAGVEALEAKNYRLVQYFLEDANFELPEEMVGIIESMRELESFQKVMQTYQEVESVLIRKLGSI